MTRFAHLNSPDTNQKLYHQIRIMSVVVQPVTEANLLQDPLRFDRRVPPCAIVIFGASGDLSKRKLLPSLYRLFYERRISPSFAVIGSSRTPMSDDQFRERMKESVSKFLEDAPFDEEVWKSFAQCLFYVPGDISNPESYDDIRKKAGRSRAIAPNGRERPFLSFDSA